MSKLDYKLILHRFRAVFWPDDLFASFVTDCQCTFLLISRSKTNQISQSIPSNDRKRAAEDVPHHQTRSTMSKIMLKCPKSVCWHILFTLPQWTNHNAQITPRDRPSKRCQYLKIMNFSNIWDIEAIRGEFTNSINPIPRYWWYSPSHTKSALSIAK